MIELKNVKGTTDYSPKEQIIRNNISKVLREVFESFGYLPIETSTLCFYDLLALKYEKDNEILKEIYQLTDQADRKLGLRYDLTVPFAKYIAMNKGITMPFKRYEIGNAYRDGPVKVGRNREFIQCDVDVVGLNGREIEVELISLFILAFKKLNIDIVIKYNNRKLLSGLMIEADIDPSLVADTITIVDKIDKLEEKEINECLIELGIKKNSINKLMEYLKMDLDSLEKLSSNDLLNEGINEVKELNNYLKDLEINNYLEFTPSLARGQEYYTGIVFEVFIKDGSIKSSVGSGGRYDKMITNFINDGNEYPAVGISFGLNVIYEYLKQREMFDNKAFTNLYIIPMNTFTASLKLANELREKGIKVDIELGNRKLKRSLEYADKRNIPYVIILGEDELKTNKIIIKDMLHSDNIEIKLDDIDNIVEVLQQ